MFTKDDLKVGYVVKLRNGDICIVGKTKTHKFLMNSENQTAYLTRWLNDLTYIDLPLFNEFDIMQVYGYILDDGYLTSSFLPSIKHRELLWERIENPREMTIKNIEKELGYKIKIVGE